MNDPRIQSTLKDVESDIQGKEPSRLYQEAIDLLNQNNYIEAAKAFEEIGQYSYAPKFAIYSKAAIAGENNDFQTACETFKLLGDFHDSPEMILYYKAREIEAKGIEAYLQAIKAYTDIIEVRDSKARILNCRKALYEKADVLYKSQKYVEAATAFEALGDYSDSYFMKVYCEALQAEKEGRYIAASDLFKSIAVFKDSSDHANECKQKQYALEQKEKQEQYEVAMREYEAGHYCAALECLGRIMGYKDVDNLLDETPFKVLRNIQNQSRLYLGLFPQVHSTRPDIIERWSSFSYSDNYLIDQVRNGIVSVRPVEWQVIKKEKNKYTLISRSALEAMAYDRNGSRSWENSMVRFWLNSFFYDKAFNAFEKGLLFVQNSNYVEQDKVTLLSADDARALFTSRSGRLCSPTIYAVANGSTGNVVGGRLICWWWLRTPGKYITLEGDIDDSDVRDSRGTVRPVIYINVDKLVEGIINEKIDPAKILGS